MTIALGRLLVAVQAHGLLMFIHRLKLLQSWVVLHFVHQGAGLVGKLAELHLRLPFADNDISIAMGL